MQISEQTVALGKGRSLVGILARPVGDSDQACDTAVVILNTGIIHRVGHNRMYVSLSRAFANAGYTVARFDFSGIGDSDKRNDDLQPLESAMSDLKEVVDWLQTSRKINRVVLVGLCLGADHAVSYAPTDHRVVGLVLMDPSTPPTFRYYRNYLRTRLLSARSWLNVLSGGRSRVRLMITERVMGGLFKNWQPSDPMFSHPKLRSELEQIYQALVVRGTKFLLVLTGGGAQTYASQLVDALPNVNFSDSLRSEFFSDPDHLFKSEALRARLQELILEWLQESRTAS